MFHYRYLSLPQATIELCQTHAADVNILKVLFSSLTLICKLFYSLNFQVSWLCSVTHYHQGALQRFDLPLFRAGPSWVFRRQHGNLDDKLPRAVDVGQQAATNGCKFLYPDPFYHHLVYAWYFFLFSELSRSRLLSKHCRTRRRRVSWSCWSHRFVTTPPSTPRSTTKSSSRICPDLSRPSGIF